MGFTLNGNTAVVAVCILAAMLIVSITAVAIVGNELPSVLSDSLIALVSAVAGGAVVHKASGEERKELKESVKDTVKDVVHEEVAHQ